jgi:F-box/leucine-rich repeat protein 2/20
MDLPDLTSHTTHQEEAVPEISSFQEKLPREIRLMVLQTLVQLHIDNHERDVQQGRWKGELARKRWYGETAGRRELLRLRRVSTSSP